MKKAALIVAAGFVLAAFGAGAAAQKGPMGEPLTRADAEARVKARFATIDTNRDGKATKEEFAAARDARREVMRDKMFERLDTDKNGQISRAEMDAGQAKRVKRMGEMGQRRNKMGSMRRGMVGQGGLFARADANGDGSITQAELLSAMMARFDVSDTNKDGVVTREERHAAIAAHVGARTRTGQ